MQVREVTQVDSTKLGKMASIDWIDSLQLVIMPRLSAIHIPMRAWMPYLLK